MGARTEHSIPLLSFFIDERVVDIVLPYWFAQYDSDKDGCLEFHEYTRFVADYHIHFAASKEAYHRLARTGDGAFDLQDFRVMLEESHLLETGASVHKDDEVGQTWRQMEDSQNFLQPWRVFVADSRRGASPPKDENSLRFVCISDTHGHHHDLTTKLPQGDVLLHTGDFSMAGELDEVLDFGRWVQSLPFKWKIVISGNHDLAFDESYHGHIGKQQIQADSVRSAFKTFCDEDSGVVYLEDEVFCIEG